MGWDSPKKGPDGHVMHCKQLRDTSLHTFVGMVGCYMKNINHFQLMHHNVSGEMMEVGMLEFVKYGVTEMKNQMCLTHQNVLEFMAMFHKHKMKKTMNSSIVRVLGQMIQTSQFCPATGWVVS